MLYKSTRGNSEVVNSYEAILKGLCDDGGLFVPEDFPKLKLNLEDMKNYSYKQVAEEILHLFFDDFSKEEISYIVDSSYDNKFSCDDIVNIKTINNMSFMELYHGPTSAFKDMALSVLPNLMTKSIEKLDQNKEVVILTATSGDTGKAALEGFHDVAKTKIIVFYPKDGVSDTQKLQMISQEGENVKVFGIDGNFDDAQRTVKDIFNDKEMRDLLNKNDKIFSSANSINIGRLVPQIIYYVYSYLQLVNNNEIKLGDKINIVVPCGNFGNILSSYYASKLIIPVNKFICASNKNNVLSDFFDTGIYDKNRELFTTISPSMDILVSSNLERFLYEISSNNESLVKSCMSSLSTLKKYKIHKNDFKVLSSFYGGYCNDKATLEAINHIFTSYNYLIDTHTAVAYKVYSDYVESTNDNTKALIASTASPYKFSKAVLKALNVKSDELSDFECMDKLHEITNVDIPKNLYNLRNKTSLKDECINKDDIKSKLKEYLNLSEDKSYD